MLGRLGVIVTALGAALALLAQLAHGGLLRVIIVCAAMATALGPAGVLLKSKKTVFAFQKPCSVRPGMMK